MEISPTIVGRVEQLLEADPRLARQPTQKDIAGLARDLPADGTWIVVYCECPRAAAESVTRKLRAAGFANTAVLWEGINGWVALGYPVFSGQAGSSE